MKPDVGIPLRTAVFTGTYRLNFANIDAADAATALRRGQQPLDPRSGRGQAGALPLAVSVARVPRRSPAPPPPRPPRRHPLSSRGVRASPPPSAAARQRGAGVPAHARRGKRWRLRRRSLPRGTSTWGRRGPSGMCTSRPRTPSCCWTLWSGTRPASGRLGRRGGEGTRGRGRRAPRRSVPPPGPQAPERPVAGCRAPEGAGWRLPAASGAGGGLPPPPPPRAAPAGGGLRGARRGRARGSSRGRRRPLLLGRGGTPGSCARSGAEGRCPPRWGRRRRQQRGGGRQNGGVPAPQKLREAHGCAGRCPVSVAVVSRAEVCLRDYNRSRNRRRSSSDEWFYSEIACRCCSCGAG